MQNDLHQIEEQLRAESVKAESDPIIAPLRQVFADQAISRLEQLAALIEHGNIEAAQKMAHALKGSAGMYGFQTIYDFALGVEHSLQNKKLETNESRSIVCGQLNEFRDICSRILLH